MSKQIIAHDVVVETKLDGTTDGVPSGKPQSNSFFDFADKGAVVRKIRAIPKQGLGQAVVYVEGGDEQFKGRGIAAESVGQPHNFFNRLISVAVVEDKKFRSGKAQQIFSVEFALVLYEFVKQLGDVREKAEGHVVVDRVLVFDKHEEMIVDGTGDVVLLLVEENAFESVDFQAARVSVIRVEDSVAKREQAHRLIEIGAEDGITIFGVRIRHNLTSEKL